jgi:thioredoxin reductase (NADPH)
VAVGNSEVLIVGGGVAALTAALFSARQGRATLVLTGGLGAGGSLLSVGRIEDFPGFPEGVPGYDLCPMVQEQAAAAGVEFRMDALDGLKAQDGAWLASTSEGELEAPAIIVATGSRLRRLGIPGEEELTGKGVSQCATCDGPLARGETVAVVGGGDSALLETLELIQHVGRVLLFHRGESLDGQQTYRERVLAHPDVEVHYQTDVEEIAGEDRVSTVRVRKAGESVELEVAAVFVYVGTEANTAFLAPPLRLTHDGRIPTDASLRTDCVGIFAAGDVRVDSAAQAVAAAGDGATAAIAAHRYLDDRRWPVRALGPDSVSSD